MWKYNETDNLPGDSIYHSADELYHYGILGMRWGHRKSKINTMNKELKRYRKLEKEEKKKQKLNKIESERYKKANTGIKKFGVNKYIKGQKIARVGSAIGGALSANATLGAIRSTSRFIKRKQTGKAVVSSLLAGFGAIATSGYISANKEARRNINQANEYEYNQYKKKYSKVK